MKKSKFAITVDDDHLLLNLWRWKFLTTSMIYNAVYSHRTLTACFKRLTRLEKNKFIESFVSQDGKRYFWQLTEKGYKSLIFDDQKIIQVGFKSENKNHDVLVTLLHFGIWKSFSNANSAIYTEQELRRIDLESYPDWVPHTKLHRPDGYFKIDLTLSNDKSLVAIEVELNLKSAETYIELGRFYTDMIGIHQVIWLVKSETDAHFILRNLIRGSSSKATEHSFIILNHWFQSLWQTEIFIGKNQNQRLEKSLDPTPVTSRSQIPAEVLFDFRKKLMNSTTLINQTKAIPTYNKIIGC